MTHQRKHIRRLRKSGTVFTAGSKAIKIAGWHGSVHGHRETIESGFHIGTQKAALDRLTKLNEGNAPHRIQTYQMDFFEGYFTKPYLPDGRMLSELNPLDKTELFGITNLSSLRAKLVEQVYDFIPYINATEDPGSVSYMVLDPSKLRKLKSRTVGSLPKHRYVRGFGNTEKYLPERDDLRYVPRPGEKLYRFITDWSLPYFDKMLLYGKIHSTANASPRTSFTTDENLWGDDPRSCVKVTFDANKLAQTNKLYRALYTTYEEMQKVKLHEYYPSRYPIEWEHEREVYTANPAHFTPGSIESITFYAKPFLRSQRTAAIRRLYNSVQNRYGYMVKVSLVDLK